MKPFSIIVAFDSQYGIGKNGQLPWKLPSDLKHFKQITTTVIDSARKNAVIMGRKTWDSLPRSSRPLPGRINLVLSKEGLKPPSGVLCLESLDEALSRLSCPDIENIFVIGGARIFALAVDHPLCQKIYVTHVEGKHGCDVFFPPISQRFFPISVSEKYAENGIAFHFSEYLRS
jgi:dihydrofolate reductase/thymidylate synthase